MLLSWTKHIYRYFDSGVLVPTVSVNQSYVNNGDAIELYCRSDPPAENIITWHYEDIVVRYCELIGGEAIADEFNLTSCDETVDVLEELNIVLMLDNMAENSGEWICKVDLSNDDISSVSITKHSK